jgi:CIC family chloride channel protein
MLRRGEFRAVGELELKLPGSGRGQDGRTDVAGNRFVGFSAQFWALLVLTGIGAGIGAGLLMDLLRAVQHVCYSYRIGSFLQAVQNAPVQRRVLVVFCAGVVASVGVFLLKESPGGSGGKLNERIWFHSGRLAEFKTIAQAALSITIVGMGASLGRETAPKQTGAAVASWLSRKAGLSSAESRLLAAYGAGAGMAAVYNVPLGGALFALEVLLGTLALPLIPPALAASVIATGVSWLMLPDQPTYIVSSNPVALTQLIWSIGFGPIAGAASVIYVRLIILADGVKLKRGLALAMPIVAFSALGVLAIRYPQLLGNGKDVTQLGFTGALGLPLLLALMFLKPVATAACLGSGAPGGLFTPSITFGAMLGGLLGHFWSLLWPGPMPGSYAIIGAAAVLAASMQAPIAALVLLLELTHHIVSLLVPILFAVAGAAVTARRLDRRSVYTGRVHAGRTAAEGEPPSVDLRYRRLLEPPRTISVAANYPEILERFVAEVGAPKPLYVIDERARFAGRIQARSTADPPPLTRVLSTAAAGDLMELVEPLDPTLSETAALSRLDAEPLGELPVVDVASGRLLGVAKKPSNDAVRGGFQT